MPRRPRGRRRRAHREELGTWDEFALIHGPLWDWEHTPERMADLWETFGEEFLEKWIEAHPGTRPWAWWAYEAPDEPRRVLNPLDAQTVAKFPNHFLIVHEHELRRMRGRILGGPLDADGQLVPWLEEEWDYLARLDLLYPGEAERIPDKLPPAGMTFPPQSDDEDEWPIHSLN